jgi:sterol 3beta-glucosyltransferase
MRITLLTAGTLGDTQPYIALGVTLKRIGFNVRLATFEDYAELIAGHGLEHFPIKGDLSKVIASESGVDAMKADNPLKIALSFSKLKSFVFKLQKQFFDSCHDTDAVVYHPGVPIGYFIAKKKGIPSILATPFPMTPTSEYPALIFYNGPRLGRAYNILTHRIFQKIMWSAAGPAVKQFWRYELGIREEVIACPFGEQTRRKAPTIVSCSNHVFARPTDWPEHVYNTGYWFLEEEPAWAPPAELLAFLDKGAPPIYVGFGSIGDPKNAKQTTLSIINTLISVGQRGIIATGWNGLSRIDGVGRNIYFIESAPHSWLFPRMAAVVHHGGAGTTAAALRAGVPSVVIPSGNDQHAWARRVYELGVGSKPVPKKKLTEKVLGSAIKYVVSADIQTAAKALASRMNEENGAARAASIIAQCFD